MDSRLNNLYNDNQSDLPDPDTEIKISQIEPELKQEKKQKPVTEEDLTKFTMHSFKTPCIIGYFGKPKLGKSHAINHFIQYNMVETRKFKWAKVFTGSIHNQDFSYLPKKSLVDGYDKDKLEVYVKQLMSMKQKLGDTMPESLLVFDDVCGSLRNDMVFQRLISRFRHTNVTILLGSQYVNDKSNSTNFKEMLDFSIMFRTTSKKSLQAYYEYWGDAFFDTYAEFITEFKRCTKDKYTACLYSNDTDRGDLSKNFFRFQAPADYVKHKIEF
jgi:hypothetical protein